MGVRLVVGGYSGTMGMVGGRCLCNSFRSTLSIYRLELLQLPSGTIVLRHFDAYTVAAAFSRPPWFHQRSF